MKIDNILKNIIFGAIFLVPFIPFIVSNNLFFPFIAGKGFAFRILVEIMFGLWAVLALRSEKYRPKFSWIAVSVAIFVVIIGLADISGVNPMKSIWSNFERMEGFVTLLHLFGFFIVTTSILQTEKLWHRFFNISISASVLMGFYGLMQMVGVFETHQGSRLDATMGNSAYLAVYMLVHIFLTLFLFLRSEKNSLIRWFYGGAIILQTIILYYTATRGALLGLLGGLFVSSLFIAFFEKENIRIRNVFIGGLVAIVVFVGLFIGMKDTSFVQKSQVLKRFANISLQEGTTKARFMVWGMAWEGFKEKPILGWGQENFNYVFNKYYNPGMYDQEQWFDRTHNVFFDWLIAGGLFGLLGYLSLFFAIIYYLIRDKNNHFSIVDKAIILGLLAGYFIHNLFVFDHLVSYILFFSLLGYIHSSSMAEDEVIYPNKISEEFNRIAIPVVIVLALFSIHFFNTKAIMTNISLLNTLKPHKEGITKNLEYYQKASSYGFVGRQETREQLAQFGIRFAGGGLSPEIRKQMIDLVISEMQKQIEEDPKNARIESIIGTFFGRVGDFDSSVVHLNRALELSPKKVSIWELAGNVYLFKGDLVNAKEYFKKAFELASEFKSLRIGYAASLIQLKEDELVKEILLPAFDSVLVDDDRIVQAYVGRKDYNKAIAILENRVHGKPNDVQTLLSLGAVYSEAGYKTKAIETIRGVIELDPNFKDQGEYYIQEIKAGR